MNRFEDKVVIVTGLVPVSVLPRRAAFCGKAHSSSTDGVPKLHETIAGFDEVKSLVHPGDVSDVAYVKSLVKAGGEP